MTVIAVLSIIPGNGSALVWVQAAIIFIFTGEIVARNGLALFCALVGVCWTTCDGDALFGAMGFIVSPGGACRDPWEMFGTAIRSALAEPVVSLGHEPRER